MADQRPLEQVLKEDLADLYREVTTLRKNDSPTEEIEQTLDMFADKWHEKLKEHQLDAHTSCWITANKAVELENAEAIQTDKLQTVRETHGLDEDAQYKYYNVRGWTRTGDHLTPAQQERVQAVYQAGHDATQERYKNLFDQLEQGVQDVTAGKEPVLSLPLEKEVEAAPAASSPYFTKVLDRQSFVPAVRGQEHDKDVEC